MSGRKKKTAAGNPLAKVVVDFNQAELRAWLDAALSGKASGLALGPDDDPQDVILRFEGDLPKINRDDLRTVCLQLIQEFARKPDRGREYADGLFYLALGLKLDDAAFPLQSLAVDKKRLMKLPFPIRAGVLTTLADLRPGMDPKNWVDVFKMDPKRHATVVFVGLAHHGLESAIRFLAKIDDRAELADTIRMLLEHRLEKLDGIDRRELADAFIGVIGKAGKRLKAALREVCGEFEIPLVRKIAVAKPKMDLSGLDQVLNAFGFSSSQPMSPQLLAA